MGKCLSEARRFFSVVSLVLLLLTLFGSHLPWMMISEEDHTHTWTITETHDGNSNTDDASFYMDMFFNLLSVESCQTFQEDSAFFYKGQEMCSVMTYDDSMNKYTTDTHDWDIYMESCESAGTAAFALIVVSVGMLVMVVLFATVKNVQRKCCPEAYERQHDKAKCLVPCCAALAPISALVAVILYFVQCIQDAQGKDVITAEDASEVKRKAEGYQGFWIAMAGAICLLFWWILFTFWFCNKRVASAEFAGASSRNMNANDTAPLNEDSDHEDSMNI